MMRGGWSPWTVFAGAFVAVLLLVTCTESSDPCDGVGCSSRGFCVQDQGTPYCACLHGYHPAGLGCVANDATLPCAGIDCGGHGTCVADGTDVSCRCEADYVWLLDPADPTCSSSECDLSCVSAVPPDGPCVLDACQGWCRRMWGGLVGQCVLGICTCTVDCDPTACQAECTATGYTLGECTAWGCECSGEPTDADADADDADAGGEEDVTLDAEPAEVTPDDADADAAEGTTDDGTTLPDAVEVVEATKR